MKLTILIRLAQYRVYWLSRKIVGQLSFFLAARLYIARQYLATLWRDTRTLRDIASTTTTPLLWAICTATILQVTNPCAADFAETYGLAVPGDSDYITFLGVIASIGGVFIGLYYAAIATVGSAMYARVPNNLRDLLVEDRAGNVYMRFLAYVTCLCLILICLRLSSLPRVYLAPPLSTLFAGVGLFAFVRLGQRAFHLFDPATLAWHPFDQLERFSKSVTAGNFRWLDQPFQSHAQRQASLAIDAIEALKDFLRKEEHLSGTSFIDLSRRTVQFLIVYAGIKSRIPTTSFWYPQVNTFPEWYRSDHTSLSMASQTGTTIGPASKGDISWLEERLYLVLLACLKVNLEAAKWQNAATILQYVNTYVASLARQGDGKAAVLLFERIVSQVEEAFKLPLRPSESETIHIVGIGEFVASIPITLSLAFRRKYESLKYEIYVNRIEAIDWKDSRTQYKAGFDTAALSQMEYLAPRLEFELDVEGHAVSPTWFVAELVMQADAERFVENIGLLLTHIPKKARSTRDLLNQTNRCWTAAAMLSRQWEYLHKLQSQLDTWQQTWSELNDHRRLQDLQWPNFDIGEVQSALKAENLALLTEMSDMHGPLSASLRPATHPDYAGQFLHNMGEALMDSLISNDSSLVNRILGSYFSGSMVEFSKQLARPVPEWQREYAVKAAADPMLDLMELSGYASLFAEKHENPALWSPIKQLWDRYLDSDKALDAITALLTLVESGLEMQPRAFLRYEWKQQVSRSLAQVPGVLNDGFPFEDNKPITVQHPSALVRVVASNRHGVGYSGLDIFVTTYLSSKARIKNMRRNWRRSSLARALAEEAAATPPTDSQEERQ